MEDRVLEYVTNYNGGALVEVYDPDVVIGTESLQKEINDNEMWRNQFKNFRRDRGTRRGGIFCFWVCYLLEVFKANINDQLCVIWSDSWEMYLWTHVKMIYIYEVYTIEFPLSESRAEGLVYIGLADLKADTWDAIWRH